MRKLFFFFVLLFAQNAFCVNIDTINITSKISDVTVFFSGAQITRTVDLKITKGQHLLKFDQLPFEINPQSIQVQGIDHCDILSVKHLVNYYNASVKDKEEKEIQKKIDDQELKIKDINNRLSVFDLESKLLLDNSNLQKKDDGSAINDIREAADYYSLRLNEILLGKLKLNTELKVTSDSIQSLYSQMNEINSKKRKVFSQILVLAECSENINSSLKLSYYIASAGWVPLYDFRVDDITKPLSIVYNSNVYQSTGEDWNNVNIRLSTNNPSLSGNKPELLTWNLGQYNSYENNMVNEGISGIRGRVNDAATNEPVPFANVVIKQGNTMISGAVTDINGQYTIKPVPSGYYTVEVSYIGYNNSVASNVSLQADKFTVQDFLMEANTIALQEVAIVYQNPDNVSRYSIDADQVQYEVGGISGENDLSQYYKAEGKKRTTKSITGWSYDAVDMKNNEEVTSNYISNSLKSTLSNLEYVIDIPYNVPSDGQDYLIKIKDTGINVNYSYHAVPKLDHDAFLVAEIYDWTPLNLLSGKTSIYYQGTFTGESFIDANNASDTLSISLGRDKNIIIQRLGNKETFDKRIIGSTIKETVGYDITLKNNKQSQIRIIIEDQYPVSEKKSVEVTLLDYSGAKNDEKAGKLTWEMQLQPGEKKVLTYKYSVKYPKDISLEVE
jgi:hypothetical protein